MTVRGVLESSIGLNDVQKYHYLRIFKTASRLFELLLAIYKTFQHGDQF